MVSGMEMEGQKTNEKTTKASKSKLKASLLWFIFIVNALFAAASIVWMFFYVTRENALLRMEIGRAHMEIEEIRTNFTGYMREDIMADVRRYYNSHERKIQEIDAKIGEYNSGIRIKIADIDNKYDLIDVRTKYLHEQLNEIMTNCKQLEQKIMTVNSTLGSKVVLLRAWLEELNHETGTSNVTTATISTSTSTTESTIYESGDSLRVSDEDGGIVRDEMVTPFYPSEDSIGVSDEDERIVRDEMVTPFYPSEDSLGVSDEVAW